VENLNGMDPDVVSVQTVDAVAVLVHNGKGKGGIGKGLLFKMNSALSITKKIMKLNARAH
jgi:hypothetical protein